ncbi:type I toxin-antitoxin system antitoxin YafN [Tolumonas osonensis]|uniref:Antitoxin n=1 Tax=Tolumonas osonensis TaxID=675874 RepID=A0A841GH70_9GAMM|nr:type I toxin-antitoxin system antitoxin YafN [Tolumonas osonensis]MBB6054230.1 antitoxin YafN [Tolumonas osonensis]
MHRILAEHTVSMTELRKNPAQYFTDEPIAVLSNNKPAGYMLSASLFEAMVDLLEKQQANRQFVAKFRPTAEQLKAIALHGQELIGQVTDETEPSN